MSSLKELSEGRSDILKIDPRKIRIKEGWNSREETPDLDAHIDMLAQSISQIGVKKPIEVTMENGEPYVTDGHCRVRAALRAIEVYKADLKTIPVIPVDRYSSEADRVASQIIGNSGKPLTSFEQAKVYKKLLDLGWKGVEIASKIGKSPAHVTQVLDLLTLPENIKAMVLRGEVSGTMAIGTLKAANGDAGKAANELKEAVATANTEGRTRAMPKDTVAGAKRVNVGKAVRDAFEYAEIDDSGDTHVIITMPIEHFKVLREACEL